MKIYQSTKKRFLRPKIHPLFCVAIAMFFTICFLFSACTKKICYFDYVSELRSNIFRAQTDEFYLRLFATEKEYPYINDGIKQETSVRTEVYLLAPSGDKTCTISFTVDNKTYGGEMSYDNVKAEYYYSCTLDVSLLSQIDCTIQYGEERLQLCALSVRTETTLSPKAALDKLVQAEQELFTSLTDKYGFAGEIYLRLIHEDFPYYYVGVTGRNGNTVAFLLNAETGNILAKRQS